MKPFLFLLITFLSFSIEAFDLQSGDILLISFNCYECHIIESETSSPFSHSGVVIKSQSGDTFIAQSLTQVHLATLQDFLKNKTPHSKAYVYRPYEFENRIHFMNLENNMRLVFDKEFNGLLFDSRYLWNNVDVKGRELLYCSEFVAKFLDHFLTTPSVLYPFSFKKNYDYWIKYFQGHIPEGEMGNSPAILSQDPRFHLIGTID